MSSRVLLAIIAATAVVALPPAGAHGQVPGGIRPGVGRPIGALAPQLQPMGISVLMLAAPSFTGTSSQLPLGMASTFKLDDSVSQQSSATSTGKPANGMIQFAPGNQQALLINKCFVPSCQAILTINNLTPQGKTVYTLRFVQIKQVQMGQTVNVSFTYTRVDWQTYAPGSATPSQTGTWNITE